MREGVWLLLGAMRTHMMYGLRRAKHVHVVSRHVHCRSHVGTMMAWGWAAWLPALIRVKNLVCLLDCSVSAIWWTALLWHAMYNPFMYLLEHVECRCDQVSIMLFEHRVQFGFGCIIG